MGILSFLKSSKTILAIGLIIAIGFTVFKFFDIVQSNGELRSQLKTTQIENTSLASQLSIQQEQHQKELEDYNQLMSEYLSNYEEINKQNRSLQVVIASEKQKNKELNECFDMDVPDSILTEMFR